MATPENIKALFEELDADGNGEISLEEFKKYIKRTNKGRNYKITTEEIEAKFAQDDANGDGSITLEELTKAVLADCKITPKKSVPEK